MQKLNDEYPLSRWQWTKIVFKSFYVVYKEGRSLPLRKLLSIFKTDMLEWNGARGRELRRFLKKKSDEQRV